MTPSKQNSNFLIKKTRALAKDWLLQHKNYWLNPMSIFSIYRAITGKVRISPNFIIFGAAKCGTTSLYEYLVSHPSVYSSVWKEIFYFDRYYDRGINWYCGHFENKMRHFFDSKILNEKKICGEATPTYIHNPLTVQRIHDDFPEMKLIALLRNPVDRAYSHYQMEIRLGYETNSFEDALELENERLKNELNKIYSNKNYYSYRRQIFSYKMGGLYAQHLKMWLNYFSKDQILVIGTEEFEKDPAYHFKKIESFLEIPHKKIEFKKYNVGKYDKINEKTRSELTKFFEPHNKELYKLLNHDFGWNQND